MRIIWWADNATANADNNVTWPKTCKVSYKDADGNVHEIQGMIDEKGNETDNVGVERDTSSNNGINGNNKYWNYVKFSEPIVTDELSLSIERNGTRKMCWKFNEIYIENKNNTGKIRGCIMDNLISTQRKKNMESW